MARTVSDDPPGPLHALWKESAEEMRGREETLLREALEAENWYLRGAARRLGVQCSTLQHVLATRHPELDASRMRHPVGPPVRDRAAKAA